MEELNTKLQVKLQDRDVTIDVKDIIKSETTNKEYMIYTIDDVNNEDPQVYVSLMIENEQGLILEEVNEESDFELINQAVNNLLKVE